MALFFKDPQKPIITLGPGRRNPRLTDGTTEIEMTYPPTTCVEEETENASFEQTSGGSNRKQSDTWIRRVTIEWLEPSNFVPTSIREMMRGGGDRTRQLTYKHHRELPSQLPDVESQPEEGISQLEGYIVEFKRLRNKQGRDKSGTIIGYYRLVFQESEEVRP